MIKKFFLFVNTFSTVLLVLGSLGSLIMLFTMSTVQIPDVSGNFTTYKTQFNPADFAASIGGILGSISLFCILKGIALIGLKYFRDEPEDLQSDKNVKVNVKNPQLIMAGIIVLVAIVFAIIASAKR